MSNRRPVPRPQHNNTFAFRHNPNSRKTAKILSSPNEGVCQQCWEQIEWRKKYRKYKPLTVPRRCDACQMKCIRLAYHTLCQKCATEKGTCAKCQKHGITHPYVVLGAAAQKDEEEVALSKMTERQRRTYLRELEKEQGKGKKKENSDDDLSDVTDSQDDDLEPMPAPPPRIYDRDMLVKERAKRAGLEVAPEKEESDAPKEATDEDLSASVESYEEDSDELDRVDKEAEALVGNKDLPDNGSMDESLSDAGSEAEEDDIGEEDE